MTSHPLKSITLEEATEKQFRLVDAATKYFRGNKSLEMGGLGVAAPDGRPAATATVEKIIAEFFGAEAAALVRGAGSGAIRCAVWAVAKPADAVLVHDAPIYSTTKTLFDSMGLHCIARDFNKGDYEKILEKFSFALVQHARQKLDDSYSIADAIGTIKKNSPSAIVITDDNYAALKVSKIGVECGADVSAFSSFKLLGPEGIGVAVGASEIIQKIHKMNYSGGGQVQGHEAMEALRGMIDAPVMFALRARVVDEIARRLNEGEVAGVAGAFVANAQSKVIIVQLKEPVAKKILERAEIFGAAPHPVGAESKYEFAPMFYRVSGTAMASDPSLAESAVRINPMRAGADTVIKILKSCF